MVFDNFSNLRCFAKSLHKSMVDSQNQILKVLISLKVNNPHI